MNIGNRVERPTDIIVASDDTRQTQQLHGRIVGMDTHVHAPLVTNRHDGLKEILEIGAEGITIDTVIESKKLTEKFHWAFVVLGNIAVDKPLRLNDDGINECMVIGLAFLWRGETVGDGLGRSQFIGRIVLLTAKTAENITVEIDELNAIEIERCGSVGPWMSSSVRAQSRTGMKL